MKENNNIHEMAIIIFHLHYPPKVYVNLILIKKWGQLLREYEYLKVKHVM